MPFNDIWLGTTSDDFQIAANHGSGAVPVTGDTFILTGNANPIANGTSNSAVVLVALNKDTSYTGLVGTATSYLAIGATTCNIGTIPSNGQSGSDSRRFNLNLGGTTSTVNIFSSAVSASDSGQSPIRLLGTAMTINLVGGIVSVGALATETANITLLNVSSAGSSISPQIYLGIGVTTNSLYQTAGVVTNGSSIQIPTARVSRSQTKLVHQGTGGFGTLYVDQSASAIYNGTGTVTTLNLNGTIDLSGGGGAVTFTNANFYSGSKFKDPLARAVFTNPPRFVNCSIDDVTVDVGQNRTATFG